MTRTFASVADTLDKKVTFTTLADGCYAYTAQGDPNTGVIVGDDGVIVVDTQATPAMARDVLARVRRVTDKPVRGVILTHYHAVRVLGASAYAAREIIASKATRELIVERGAADMASEIGRFPRLFRDAGSIPGLTWPTLTFSCSVSLWLGRTEVRVLHPGRGHTRGDTVVWVPDRGVLFAGDLVECSAAPYMGDAYLRDWPQTLDVLAALRPQRLVPGRGDALETADDANAAIDGTRQFVRELAESVGAGVRQGHGLRDVYRATYERMQPRYGQWAIFEHCLPFNVSRAFDEASGIVDPRIWTDERDRRMWAEIAT
jgi:glyoxylase-like metal-dependent hydrolase (beta-lactamase superfamily II)